MVSHTNFIKAVAYMYNNRENKGEITDSNLTSVSLAVDPVRTKASEWLPGRNSEISETFIDCKTKGEK